MIQSEALWRTLSEGQVTQDPGLTYPQYNGIPPPPCPLQNKTVFPGRFLHFFYIRWSIKKAPKPTWIIIWMNKQQIVLWARKSARIVLRGNHMFREANSCPRAGLEGNCDLRGTDNIWGQLLVHISEVKSSCLHHPSNISSHSESNGAKQNKSSQRQLSFKLSICSEDTFLLGKIE